uniref:ORF5 protein n=1 Tax=Cacao swollen shoot Togo B virus TaxID=2560363 RepID=A0A6G8IUH4_9VIRU|nr:ORF5 protein [Cacao swollen shoot Togo B virus]
MMMMNAQRILRRIPLVVLSAIRWKSNRKSKKQSNGATCYTTSTWFYISQKLDALSRSKLSLIPEQLPVASTSTLFLRQQLNRTPFWFNLEASIPPNQWIKSSNTGE